MAGGHGHHHDDDAYHPKDALGGAVRATGITGTAGLFVATIQNTLTKQNVGAMAVFTRFGGTITTFGKGKKLPRRETPRRLFESV